MTSNPNVPVRRERSIVVVLVSLALMSLLPAFAYASVLLLRNNQAQLEIVRSLTISTTRTMNEAVDRELDGMITTLRVLSSAPSLLEGDLQAFHQRTQEALRGSATFLLVLDETGQQLLNTRLPYGSELPKSGDLETPKKARENNKITVSDMFMGAVAKRLVFDIILPLNGSPDEKRVLMLGQNADNLRDTLSASRLPDGWHGTLIDGNHVVAISTNPDIKQGERFFLPLPDRAGSSGWSEIAHEGETYRVVKQYSSLSGWSVVAWAPETVVAKPLREAMFWLLGGGIVLMILTLAATLWMSGHLASAVRSLARTARSLGQGQEVKTRHYSVRELNTIADELVDAARKRQTSEAEIRFLMGEVAHRAKNQLSVIQSMARQTASTSDSLENFLDYFQKRIIGLARSTDLLLNYGSSGVALEELAAAHLQPFAPDDAERVSLSGPEVRLSAEASQTLGMALHELATNAAKYGAFAQLEGHLRLSWVWQDDMLELVWRETGVSLDTPASEREGFGTVVINRFLKSTLQAEIERTMHDDGLEWRFKMPRAVLLAAAPAQAPA